MRSLGLLAAVALLATQSGAVGQTLRLERPLVDLPSLGSDGTMPRWRSIEAPWAPGRIGGPGGVAGPTGGGGQDDTAAPAPLGRSAEICRNCVTPGWLGGDVPGSGGPIGGGASGGAIMGRARPGGYPMIVPERLNSDGGAADCAPAGTITAGTVGLFNDLNRPSQITVTLPGASVPQTIRLGPGEIKAVALSVSATAQASVTVASGSARGLPAPVTVNPGNLYRLSVEAGVLFLRPA